MSLTEGTQLGVYEITSQIGAGGMGEVYRATDTKLGREVAIKTLPAALATDKDRLARFEREAKLLAALNHPHIASVYSLDEHEGTLYLAMELVDGETLESRLKTGALSVEDALHLALQIAEALEAAHDKGVVHRDLKPANVMVTQDGIVKVLDFGLAKAFSENPNESNAAQSPALSVAMTQQGLVLGTAGYMSPEQASGQPTDQRADIWAFGVVLYEMLTGLPLFSGESVPHILADVLKTEPDWRRLPAGLHPRLKLMLERCLTKKPKNRYHSIAEARVDIDTVLNDPLGLAPKLEPSEMGRRRGPGLLWGSAATLVAAVVGATSVWLLTPEALIMTSRWQHVLLEGQSFRNTGRAVLTISSDGSQIAYNAVGGLRLRSIGEREARVITGTEAALTNPTFSPDGQSLAFFSPTDAQIQKISTAGGTPVNLVESVENPLGMSWESDGSILYGTTAGFMRISEDGGEPELIVSIPGAGFPQLLPGGRAILYHTPSEVGVYSLESGESKLLFPGVSPHYVPTGHIVYADGPVLFAVPFDVDRLEVTGGQVPMVDDVQLSPELAQYAVSDTGSLVSVATVGLAPVENGVLEWVNLDGERVPLPLDPRPYRHPRISPDGTRLAVQTTDGNGESDVWVYELDGNTQIRQLTGQGNNSRPLWTPDGGRLTFVSDREGGQQIFWQDAGLGGIAEPLTPLEDGNPQVIPDGWFPDGSALMFTKISGGTVPFNQWMVAPGSDPEFFAEGLSGANAGGAPSPNGEWLAYTKGQEQDLANQQLYIQPYPPDGSEYALTQQGGSYPLWSPEGTELFYRRGSFSQGLSGVGEAGQGQEFATVGITLEGTPLVSAERLLPISDFKYFSATRDYDIHPDGERLIMIFPEQQASSAAPIRPRINVILNWFEELEERVPAD